MTREKVAVMMSRVSFSLLLVGACSVFCAAQSRVGGAASQTPAPIPISPQMRTTTTADRGGADEDFDLNIQERHINEQNFFASTEISAGGESARGLNLRVGVAVGAERIDVLLRNVQGHVRFRASLDALRRVLDARRVAPTNEPPSVVP